MIEIDRVKEKDILITEESRSGQQYFVYGPVVSIERGTNEVGIKTTEGNRLFPIAKLWTIPAFITHKMHEAKDRGEQRRFPPNQNWEARILAGFIATLLTENAGQNGNILKEIKQKNIQPTIGIQDVLEALINL